MRPMRQGDSPYPVKALPVSVTAFLGLCFVFIGAERASGQTLTNLDKKSYEVEITEGTSVRGISIGPEKSLKLECKKSCTITFKNALEEDSEGVEADLLDTVVIESGRISLEDEEPEDDPEDDPENEEADGEAEEEDEE